MPGLQEGQVVGVEPHAERAHARLVEPGQPRIARRRRAHPRRGLPRAPRAPARRVRSPCRRCGSGPRTRSGAARACRRASPTCRPRTPRPATRARAPSRSMNAREPTAEPLPVDSDSSPSKETNTSVRGRCLSAASTRASSIRTPTPPPSSYAPGASGTVSWWAPITTNSSPGARSVPITFAPWTPWLSNGCELHRLEPGLAQLRRHVGGGRLVARRSRADAGRARRAPRRGAAPPGRRTTRRAARRGAGSCGGAIIAFGGC